VRASKKNSSKFFSLKFFFVVHTNKHVEQPQKFPRGAPLPFFSFYFPFSFGSELAGGRASGRFPFLGFTGTTRGREPRPGSSTGAIAHTPPGAETRTVEALPGDGGRPPGRPPARAPGEGEGRDEGRWSMHVLQQVHLLLQEEAQLLRLSSVFVLCCLVWFGLFSFVAGIVSRYW